MFLSLYVVYISVGLQCICCTLPRRPSLCFGHADSFVALCGANMVVLDSCVIWSGGHCQDLAACSLWLTCSLSGLTLSLKGFAISLGVKLQTSPLKTCSSSICWSYFNFLLWKISTVSKVNRKG